MLDNHNEMLKSNYEAVKKNIKAACERSGRDKSEVCLIAVSKTKPQEDIMQIYECGEHQFGENYVQEMVDKVDALPKDIVWHMIGHLQRNKVKYVVGRASMIHSVDSLRLAEAINQEAVKKGIVAEDNRCYFRQLKQLCVDINAKNIDNINMDVLSMGMTNDYVIAVEEGATHIRVGTAIFGHRDYGNA